MTQPFYHNFYIILGMDVSSGTKLIKVGNVRDSETRLNQRSTQYPTFITRGKLPIRLSLSNTNQIETIEAQMKDICINRSMERYGVNHGDGPDNEWFALNKVRVINIVAIIELLTMFYPETDFNALISKAEALYNGAFDD